MELDLSEAIAAFKIGWAWADKEGMEGQRTEVGMTAAAPLIAEQVLAVIADELHSAFPITVPDIKVGPSSHRAIPKPPLGDDIYNLQAEAAGLDAAIAKGGSTANFRGYWELAQNCSVLHAYGENNWRPADWKDNWRPGEPVGRHEHWINAANANIYAIDNYSDEDD